MCSEITKGLGTPFEFIYKDKVYKVSPITQDIKAKFEQRLYALSLAGAKSMRKICTGAEYSEFLQGINDKHTAGFFSYDNQKWLQTGNGVKILASLCFGLDDEIINQMAKEQPEEMKALFTKIFQDAAGLDDEQMSEVVKKVEDKIANDE